MKTSKTQKVLNFHPTVFNSKKFKSSYSKAMLVLNQRAIFGPFQIRITVKDQEHKMKYICSTDIQPDDEQIARLVESNKSNLAMKKVYETHPILSRTKGRLATIPPENPTENGLSQFIMAAKFIRMRNLHEFLFHAIYGVRNRKPLVNREEILTAWTAENFIDKTDELSTELPTIYSSILDWRTFIAPTEDAEVFSLEELVQNMPLSIFLTLNHIDLSVPELRELLMHPIKRHLLLKQTPNVVRAQLAFYKSGLYNVHAVAKQLGYIGLLQMVDKPAAGQQVFVYLNRRASLLNTSSSAPAYHKIEAKDYPRLDYSFESFDDVATYWINMLTICGETKLNTRSTLGGKELLIETLQGKKDLADAVVPRSIEEVRQQDCGHIPGDRLGAAGLDSALFVHLKMNWTTKPRTNKKQISKVAVKRLDSKKSKKSSKQKAK